MKTSEDISTDENIGTETIETKDLARQFMRPAYTWRGFSLRPYTAGTDQLFSQIFDPADAPMTMFLSFIFIHVYERSQLVALCWDKAKFHEAFIAWLDELGPLTSEEKTQAMKLFEDVRGWARKSAVEVIPENGSQKKTKARARHRSLV